MASADLIASELLAILTAAKKPAEKPAGFITAKDAALAWGIKRGTAGAKLHDGFKAGLFERKKWGRFHVYAPKKK